MINYDVVKQWRFDEQRVDYSERDTMLYALGIGLGFEPVDRGQLRYVYEQNLQAVPSMATILGSPGVWWRDPRTGADALKLVHGEQHLRIFRPLPASGALIARNSVHSLTDKGAGKGAIGVVRRELFDATSGDVLAQGTNVSFLRGDGGFSAASGVSDPAPEPLPAVPERAADHHVTLPSPPQSALIYRLSGDDNPLHADPDIARRAGFERPILHGLCTYGIAAHAVLRACLDYDASRFVGLATRFTAPVLPGESVRFEIWRETATRLRLRATVDARQAVVLNNGVIDIKE